MVRSRVSWLMVAAAMVFFVSCQTLTEELPTEPTEATEATEHVAAITIPIILPATNPAPAPAPTATAAPVPGTSPTPNPGTPPPPPPPPSGGSCTLGGGDPNHSCSRTSNAFLADVDTAIDRVVDSKPHLFDMNNRKCPTCYRIEDHDGYIAAVETEMRRMGYCVHYDGEELGVKNTNSFNDQYDISTSRGFIRRGDGSYRSTCRPAWF